VKKECPNNFCKVCQIHELKEMEKNMKKVNLMSGSQNAEVNVKVDVKADVKIGNGGGGGAIYLKLRVILLIIMRGFLPSLRLVYLVSRSLSFWL
jgi:hypothetical protein